MRTLSVEIGGPPTDPILEVSGSHKAPPHNRRIAAPWPVDARLRTWKL